MRDIHNGRRGRAVGGNGRGVWALNHIPCVSAVGDLTTSYSGVIAIEEIGLKER